MKWAFAAAMVPVAAVYAYSISPNPGYGDSAELATVAYILGVAHTTGFPAFVLLGWIASHAVPFSTIWWRVALVSEFGVLAACAALWLTLCDMETPPWVATFATWIFAFGTLVWAHATRVEVHALTLGFQALALAFAIRFNLRGKPGWLVASCACAGLALAGHSNAMWILPAVGLLALTGVRKPDTRASIAALGCGLLPLLLYAYILPRAAWLAQHQADPTVALGVPAGQPFWNWGNAATPAGFWWLLTGAHYHPASVLGATLDPRRNLAALPYFLEFARDEYGWLCLAIAIVGVAAALRTYPRVASALLLTIFLAVSFAFQFRSIESDIVRYLLLPLWIVALFCGLALAAASRLRYGQAAALAIGAILATSAFWQDRGLLSQRGDPGSTMLIARVRQLTPEDAVIVGSWTYAMPIGYAIYAERSMGARVVVNSEIQYDPGLLKTLVSRRPTYVIFEVPFSPSGFVTKRLDDVGSPYIYRVTGAPRALPVGARSAKRGVL
jgi:hypothetical protein